MTKLEFVGKCVFVEAKGKKILVVGDLHLGYEEALNKAGIGVSRRLFGEMMDDFKEIFGKIGDVDEVVLLGDVKHVFGTVLGQEREDFRKLLEYLRERCRKVVIVQGNHDSIVGFLIRENTEVRDCYCFDGVCFLHGDKDFPEIHESNNDVWIIGHAHPAVILNDGVKHEKYKCFLDGYFGGKRVVIVPSFVDHSPGVDARSGDLGLAWDIDLRKFRVKAVGEKLEVFDFGELGKIKE
ncbi:metallophosphoesterase [Candidatus Pacearchaeota archaeon]|nr:metallophosphoesterase [Candidatus Pacearchaeota archaeon]